MQQNGRKISQHKKLYPVEQTINLLFATYPNLFDNSLKQRIRARARRNSKNSINLQGGSLISSTALFSLLREELTMRIETLLTTRIN